MIAYSTFSGGGGVGNRPIIKSTNIPFWGDRQNYPYKILIKDLNTKQYKLLTEIKDIYQPTNLRWSNNSRYLSFSTYSTNTNTNIIYIYDINNNILKKIPLIGYKYDSFPEIVISDDGKKALIVPYESDNKNSYETYSMYLFELDNDVFNINKNVKLKTLSINCVKFMGLDKILFIDTLTNSLIIYEINSKKIVVVDTNVKNFELSSDSKNIAYVKYLPQEGADVYVCKINDFKILNKDLLYKGFLPVKMHWSQDNKKILMRGATYSDVNKDYIQIRNSATDFMNLKYLVIEFQ